MTAPTTTLSPALAALIRQMPKVELHVHFQGAMQPETVLELARRNRVSLPFDTLEGLREWFRFRDFRHFIDVYMEAVRVTETVEDIEYGAWAFLQGQAAQNIIYSELTFTPRIDHLKSNHPPFSEQLAAFKRATMRAEKELGISMGVVIDFPRDITVDEADLYVNAAIEGYGRGVVAFGIGGYEPGNPIERYRRQFDAACAAGVPNVPHAGEHVGPESVWSAIRVANPARIGHGVRSIEDPELVAFLRDHQIPLEICPTSNIALKGYPTLADHPIQRLIDAGVIVTVNSDDPPMFSTTLTDEFLLTAETFGWDADTLEALTLNAVRSTLLPDARKAAVAHFVKAEFARLSSGG